MAQGTELDIGNISALIIESADREMEAKLIKTNKKDKEYRQNKGFSGIRHLFAYERERKGELKEGEHAAFLSFSRFVNPNQSFIIAAGGLFFFLWH